VLADSVGLALLVVLDTLNGVHRLSSGTPICHSTVCVSDRGEFAVLDGLLQN
jgi:hypothetical protein